jgi:hypothetical protein
MSAPNAEPASMTGLPAAGSRVCVGPPLSASGPSWGSAVSGEPVMVAAPTAWAESTRSNAETSALADPRLAGEPPVGFVEARSNGPTPPATIVSRSVVVAARSV